MASTNPIQQLSNVPVQTPFLDSNRNISLGWIQWLQAVFNAIKYLATLISSIVSGTTTFTMLTLTGTVPVVAVGQVGLGSTTSATATLGTSTLPASPQGFLIINVAGTEAKVPYYNA